MIIFKDKEVAILCPTKVGSSSLFEVFKRVPNTVVTVARFSINELKEHVPELAQGIDDYTFYGFYRDPLERFVSSYNHALRNEPTIPQDISPIELVRTTGYFAPQVKWLGFREDVRLMDFRDFETNIRSLTTRYAIPIGEIPVVNASVGGKTVADLSSEEVEFVKDLYKKDYDFFASKGIHFT